MARIYAKHPAIKIGDRFGRLVVVQEPYMGVLETSKTRTRVVKLACDCDGKTVSCAASNLKSGNIQSCGCLRVDVGRARKTHGASKTSLFRTWSGMRTRCTNAQDSHYPTYGGRGIQT
jgi:hypothetical protein